MFDYIDGAAGHGRGERRDREALRMFFPAALWRQPRRIVSCADARSLARARLPWLVFDYIDGAAGHGRGERRGREALSDIMLQPRVLRGAEHRSLRVALLGQEAGLPFGISPMGMCNLSAPGADLMLARVAAREGVPVGVSTVASTSLETMIEAAEGNAWFQLYFGGSVATSRALVERCRASGYKTLVVTVDTPEVGRRPRELRRGFKMPFKIGPSQFVDFACHPHWSVSTLLCGKPELANFGDESGIEFDRTSSRAGADWDLLREIREQWQGNLVVKGVLHPDDAVTLQAMGVDAVQVSSHGGRQLDSGPPPIRQLPRIREAVGPDFPLFYDSGIRGGEDVVKAYASGADYVFLGRPFQFAIAAAGEDGLDQLVDVLSDEVSITLAQLGHVDMQGVGPDCLA